MAVETVQECLDRILSTLNEEQRGKFVHMLAERKKEPRVFLCSVEGKKHWEVATVMVDTFLDNPAVDVAVELFTKMGLEKKAKELVELAEKCGYKPAPAANNAAPGGPSPAEAAGPPPAAPAAPSSGEHVVDRYRTALIQKLTLIEPLLDVLFEKKVINLEMYDDIRSEKTPQMKMRKLYDYLDGAGNEGKDIFWSVLKKDQEFLVRNLEKN